jgi:type VI protein secretion system component Hcp
VAPSGTNSGKQVPEQISLSYAKILIEVKERDKDGPPGKEVEAEGRGEEKTDTILKSVFSPSEE